MDESSGTSTPRPDPTILTTEQLGRAIDNLQTLLERTIDAEAKLTAERFADVRRMQNLAEKARIEQKKDTKEAVDLALSSAKESIQALRREVDDLKNRANTSRGATEGEAERQGRTFAWIGAGCLVLSVLVGIVTLAVTLG